MLTLKMLKNLRRYRDAYGDRGCLDRIGMGDVSNQLCYDKRETGKYEGLVVNEDSRRVEEKD